MGNWGTTLSTTITKTLNEAISIWRMAFILGNSRDLENIWQGILKLFWRLVVAQHLISKLGHPCICLHVLYIVILYILPLQMSDIYMLTYCWVSPLPAGSVSSLQSPPVAASGSTHPSSHARCRATALHTHIHRNTYTKFCYLILLLLLTTGLLQMINILQ